MRSANRAPEESGNTRVSGTTWIRILRFATAYLLVVLGGVFGAVALLRALNMEVAFAQGLWISVGALVAGAPLAISAVSMVERYTRPIARFSPSRAVVFMPTRIGDIVIATGCVRAIGESLRQRGTRVDLVVRSGADDLLRCDPAPFFEEILVYPRDEDDAFGVYETRFDRVLGSLRLARRLRANRYGLGVLLTRSRRMAGAAMMAGIPRRVGYGLPGQRFLLSDRVPFSRSNRDRRDPLVARTQYFGAIANYVGYEGPTLQPVVHLSEQAKRASRILLRTRGFRYPDPWYVCIAPGAGLWNRTKIWPPERFAELATRLRTEAGFNVPIIFTFGPGERELRQRVGEILTEAQQPFHWIDHQDTDLQTLGALFSRALLVVCNDSGPFHLTRATGGTAVGLCGPTSPLHHQYDAPGRYTLLRPSQAARDALSSAELMNEISTSDVLSVSVDLTNQAILRRKIDKLIRDLPGQLDCQVEELGAKIAQCIPALEDEKKRLEEEERGNALSAGDRERLAFIYLLVGQKNESLVQFRILLQADGYEESGLHAARKLWAGMNLGSIEELGEQLPHRVFESLMKSPPESGRFESGVEWYSPS